MRSSSPPTLNFGRKDRRQKLQTCTYKAEDGQATAETAIHHSIIGCMLAGLSSPGTLALAMVPSHSQVMLIRTFISCKYTPRRAGDELLTSDLPLSRQRRPFPFTHSPYLCDRLPCLPPIILPRETGRSSTHSSRFSFCYVSLRPAQCSRDRRVPINTTMFINTTRSMTIPTTATSKRNRASRSGSGRSHCRSGAALTARRALTMRAAAQATSAGTGPTFAATGASRTVMPRRSAESSRIRRARHAPW